MTATATRAALLADRSTRGVELSRALCAATDAWVQELFEAAAGGSAERLALAAVGGYGRGELAPGSDLDLVLLHDGRKDVAAVAERLWYPIWDARLKLGHAVGTVKEVLRLAASDLDTATASLSVRHLAGDERLSALLGERAAARWRDAGGRWLKELARSVAQRHQQVGEVAFLLEPNLKEGRGGLRDVHALRWAEAASRVLLPGDDRSLADAEAVLLGARVELHRARGDRPGDVLLLQDQDEVASRLGYADADRLMAAVAAAARHVAWVSDEAWARVRSTLDGPTGRGVKRDHPLAPGVVAREGEVHLDREADPATDPALALRAAAASARSGMPIDRASLDRLAAETPAFGERWPLGALDELLGLLLEGHAALRPLESLDQRGLLEKVLPEWGAVRSKPQRNALHRYTVDRHLLECCAQAAALAPQVSRPDLLVLGALFHDLGKGFPGDHSEVGVELLERIGPRMGLAPTDTPVVAALVRHHLLLPEVATRRDLSDAETIRSVAEAVRTPLVLELLAALTEADSKATSATTWGSWKAGLVADLVARVAHVVGGGEVHEVAWSVFPDAETLAAMGARRFRVVGEGTTLTVVAPDRPGVLSRSAGVLALHGLDVLAARAHSDESGMAASRFSVVLPGDGTWRGWEPVVADLEDALRGRLALEARLAERVARYRSRRPAGSDDPPAIVVDNEASSAATVVEVRTVDRMGVLFRVTQALAELQLDIRHATVATLGPEVVDTFYVRDARGEKITDARHLAELERAVRHSLSLV